MTLMARLMLQCALDAQWVGDLFEQVDVRGSLQLRRRRHGPSPVGVGPVGVDAAAGRDATPLLGLTGRHQRLVQFHLFRLEQGADFGFLGHGVCA